MSVRIRNGMIHDDGKPSDETEFLVKCWEQITESVVLIQGSDGTREVHPFGEGLKVYIKLKKLGLSPTVTVLKNKESATILFGSNK